MKDEVIIYYDYQESNVPFVGLDGDISELFKIKITEEGWLEWDL